MFKKTLTTLIIFTLLFFIACGSPAETPLDHLTLGERFLLEMNYEQALVHFLALIDIEPMNPRGYTGAAEAHIGLGQVDEAIAVLRLGQERLPDNVEIRGMLEDIEQRIYEQAREQEELLRKQEREGQEQEQQEPQVVLQNSEQSLSTELQAEWMPDELHSAFIEFAYELYTLQLPEGIGRNFEIEELLYRFRDAVLHFSEPGFFLEYGITGNNSYELSAFILENVVLGISYHPIGTSWGSEWYSIDLRLFTDDGQSWRSITVSHNPHHDTSEIPLFHAPTLYHLWFVCLRSPYSYSVGTFQQANTGYLITDVVQTIFTDESEFYESVKLATYVTYITR